MSGTKTAPQYASKRGVFSWMLFDWAAQPYHTLLITFIFAPYFASYVAETPIQGQETWGYATAVAGIIIAIFAPILGAVADASGPRKPWIAVFSVFAIIGAATLYVATPGGGAPMMLVLTAFVVALIGLEFATIFTNAMMPQLVPRSELGKLSGSGWALGYVGGLIVLIFTLALMSASPETGKTLLGLDPIFGLNPAQHEGDRASGPLSAIWYGLFIIPLFLFTPDVKASGQGLKIAKGINQLVTTLKQLPKNRSLFAFLFSSMLYRDGLNALYAFGGIYAVGVLGLSIIEVGVFGILAAITGAVGAFIGGRLDARFGPRPVVFVSCWFLVIACVLIVSTTKDVTLFVLPIQSDSLPLIMFYIAGAIIGAAGGTLQAASRTLLVDQVDPANATQAFGLYALSGRATAFIGPLAIGVMTAMTANQRIGITPVIMLLILGAIGLNWVNEKSSTSNAHQNSKP